MHLKTGKSISFFRNICFLMALILLVASVPVSASSAVSAKKAANNVNMLDSGVYRIRNLGTGLYIDCYDFVYDSKGSSYLGQASGGTAQDIYVKRFDDGTYGLYPQSEGGKYALSYQNGVTSGCVITKKAASDKTEKFVIYASGDSSYTISPAYLLRNSVTLDISDAKSRFKHNYLELDEYTGKKSQQWVFEKVETQGISLAFVKTKVKLYSVGSLYATLTPYNFETNNVKWSSSDENVLMIDNNGTYCALTPGTVTVTASIGDKTAECTIVVSADAAFTWYSQHSISASDWNGEALSGIYFTSGGVRKRFMIDKYGRGSDWMDAGCYVSSIAMVLNNMGAKLTKGYDFRSGQTDNLPADPYTVALANSGNYGATTTKAVLYGNPILVSRSNIDARFDVDGKDVTSTMTYNASKKAIKEALDAHPEGIVVYFSMPRKNRTHYIVFTKCVNPEAKNPNDYRFEVCDSASSTAARGDHVLFEECISYTSEGYRMSNAVSIITWDVVD
ncbi:MAG: Ig-like domain-containing protein [Clostridia bacterium]|nr:Ig-like domain-containing protein [Clostridia bacterium]